MKSVHDVFSRLALRDSLVGAYAGGWLTEAGGPQLVSINPATEQQLGSVTTCLRDDYDNIVSSACETFLQWRRVPAPVRGEFIRQIGEAMRAHKSDLAQLVTWEAGKIRSEGEGEVQEMIDMCDFAVGLSRQLYGLVMPSERPEHRLFEQWHPLGPTGVITAFNFPAAVWAWNAILSAVCGNTVIWKPSSQTPLIAIAIQQIVNSVMQPAGWSGVFSLCVGAGAEVGNWMATDRRLPLISATGSCTMGRKVAQAVAGRLGRSLLELGGNNAVIVTETADLNLALRAVLFAAVGTAGQRCTSLRRLIIHESIAEPFIDQLAGAYGSIRIGDPDEPDVLMGPLITERAVNDMLAALDQVKLQGGRIVAGGHRIPAQGFFVEPTIVRASRGMPICRQETFAPILYVFPFRTLTEAIEINNDVDQGLSSAIITDRLRDAETFLSPWGSDCGIANVNMGTSGAEIGGAFGGEKETGGGREAGSDSWKAYMRRQTCAVNFGRNLPLAQGVKFDVSE